MAKYGLVLYSLTVYGRDGLEGVVSASSNSGGSLANASLLSSSTISTSSMTGNGLTVTFISGYTINANSSLSASTRSNIAILGSIDSTSSLAGYIYGSELPSWIRGTHDPIQNIDAMYSRTVAITGSTGATIPIVGTMIRTETVSATRSQTAIAISAVMPKEAITGSLIMTSTTSATFDPHVQIEAIIVKTDITASRVGQTLVSATMIDDLQIA